MSRSIAGGTSSGDTPATSARAAWSKPSPRTATAESSEDSSGASDAVSLRIDAVWGERGYPLGPVSRGARVCPFAPCWSPVPANPARLRRYIGFPLLCRCRCGKRGSAGERSRTSADCSMESGLNCISSTAPASVARASAPRSRRDTWCGRWAMTRSRGTSRGYWTKCSTSSVDMESAQWKSSNSKTRPSREQSISRYRAASWVAECCSAGECGAGFPGRRARR